MKQVSQGKIFLADERGTTITNAFKRYCTFNFESFFNPYKTAIDKFYICNEELLTGGEFTEYNIANDSLMVILPITGAINCEQKLSKQTVDIEEALLTFLPVGSKLKFSNPYQEETINYLCLGFFTVQTGLSPSLVKFNLTQQNQFIKLYDFDPLFQLHIGRFDGRHEHTYKLKANKQLFFFVLAGVFEVDGRLLQEKDSLILWGTDLLELEALSNNALVLVIELNQ